MTQLIQQAYEELAERCDRQHDARQRDIFLALAGDTAHADGRHADAERLLARLVQLSPHSLLRPFATFADALQSPDVQDYLADLRRRYPPAEAERLLAEGQQPELFPGGQPAVYRIKDEPAKPARGIPENPAPAAAKSVPARKGRSPSKSPYETTLPPAEAPIDTEASGRLFIFLLVLTVAAAALVFAWLALVRPLLADESAVADRLPVIRRAPDFTLIDQHGKRVRFADYRGKALLVSFIFTTCNGACPATTHRLAKVHEKLNLQPELRDKVRFLSITLDPERDNPEMLRGYMRLYEIEGNRWTFLTGPVADVRTVHAAWGMWAKPAPDGQLDHPSRVFLVDPAGDIREIYNLDFLRLPWVLEDLAHVAGGK